LKKININISSSFNEFLAEENILNETIIIAQKKTSYNLAIKTKKNKGILIK